jgi:hypothetical protein
MTGKSLTLECRVQALGVHSEFGYRARWDQRSSFVYSQVSSIHQLGKKIKRKISFARTLFSPFPCHHRFP